MFERHIVVIGESMKSWAFCLNSLEKNKGNAKKILVLDFSKIQSFKPRAFRRWRFQREYLSNSKSQYLSISKFGLIGLRAIIFGLFYSFWSPHHAKSRLGKSFLKQHYKKILEAALSQELGTRFFNPSSVTKIRLIKYLHLIFAGIIASDKLKLSENDLVSVFNGRFPLEATIVQRALGSGSTLKIYERGSSQSKYETYSTSPHFNPEWWDKIKEFSLADQPLDEEKSISNYTYIRNKVEGFDSFLEKSWSKPDKHNSTHELPDSEYIVFYATSTFEYSPIESFNSRLGYTDMFEAVSDLQTVAESLDYHLVIRRHPNSLSTKNGVDFEEEAWTAFSRPKTTILGPKDRVDSHKLSQNARVCFVWRSSIGIETIFLGTPTFALGDARWAFLDECRAWSKDSIRDRILNPILLPFEKLTPYISYMARGGTALELVKSVNESFVTLHSGEKLHKFLTGEIREAIKSFVPTRENFG